MRAVGIILVLALGLWIVARTNAAPTRVGFIGDSITANGTPHYAAIHPVIIGQPSSTTTDWLPDAPNGYLRAAVRGFLAAGVKDVSVALGTNDARGLAPVAEYRSNMAIITAYLEAAGFRVIAQAIPYAIPGEHQVTIASDALLRAYQGETPIYRWFRAHPEQLRDGVHPTDAGMRVLGDFWARALRDAS